MGNVFLCISDKHHNRKRTRLRLNEINFLSNKDKNKDNEKELFTTNEKSSFNWSSMQNMLLEFNSNFYGKKITRQDIIAADKMLFYIDQDVAYHCKTLLERLLCTKHNYNDEFEKHANYSTIIPQCENNSSRSLLHNFHMIQLHKRILNALQFEGNPFEILQLIALSHAIMKITTAEFKLMNMVFCKYLSTLEIESEVNIRPLVQYLNVITNYICNCMKKCMRNENMIEDITSKTQMTVSNARRNYRMLKKWHVLVNSVRNDCSSLHNGLIQNAINNVPFIGSQKSSQEIFISCINY